jgi:glycerate kinase
MHILIAPNAFKYGLDASAAAAAIQLGLSRSRFSCTSTCFPVADGGDGTAGLLAARLGARIILVEVHDPLGRRIQAPVAISEKNRMAVIELADASGLRQLTSDEYDPLHASTAGTGELIRSVLDRDVDSIVLGVGGSATVDGATGILVALGARFLDSSDQPIRSLPEDLGNLARIDLSGMDPRLASRKIIVLCDVENSLLGPDGAAAVFGPQKGANPESVRHLEMGLERFRDIALEMTRKDMAGLKYGGAAGGTAAGMAVFLNAQLTNGIEYFLNATGFDSELEASHLVITGEGSIDRQTLEGKGPFGVAKRAKEKGIPVIGLAGKIPADPDPGLEQCFDVLMAINPWLSGLEEALFHTARNLTRTSQALGDLLAIGGSFPKKNNFLK